MRHHLPVRDAVFPSSGGEGQEEGDSFLRLEVLQSGVGWAIGCVIGDMQLYTYDGFDWLRCVYYSGCDVYVLQVAVWDNNLQGYCQLQLRI